MGVTVRFLFFLRYFCQCLDGYRSYHDPTPGVLETRCVDVDECLLGTHTCAGGTECSNTDGSYECVCQGEHCSSGKGREIALA